MTGFRYGQKEERGLVFDICILKINNLLIIVTECLQAHETVFNVIEILTTSQEVDSKLSAYVPRLDNLLQKWKQNRTIEKEGMTQDSTDQIFAWAVQKEI